MNIVKKDLINKIVIKHQTYFINHLYFTFFKVKKLDQQSKTFKRKTCIFNIFDNQKENKYT